MGGLARAAWGDCGAIRAIVAKSSIIYNEAVNPMEVFFDKFCLYLQL
jgi:hypothetical protein